MHADRITPASSVDWLAEAQLVVDRGWIPTPLHAIGPDGQTCQCPQGANCRSAGKHNVLGKWQQDVRGVEAFREVLAKRRRVNLGILTGAPSGIFVLDIDPEHDGFATMKRVIEQHGPMPRTRIVKTGSGGYHYYFQLPDWEITNRNKPLIKAGLEGLDIRGTGGMVVAPPSVSSKGAYSVQVDAEISPAPAWLLDMLRPDAPAAPAPVGEEPTFDSWATGESLGTPAAPNGTSATLNLRSRVQTPREIAYERSIVQGECKTLASLQAKGWEVQWDTTTFMAACQLVELANADWSALTVDEAKAEFLSACPPAEPGYDPEVKWESALQRVGTKARSGPVDRPPIDDFFAAPGEQAIPTDPSTGGGADRKDAPAAPPSDGGGATQFPTDAFIHPKDGLLAKELATAVMSLGPIKMGQNNRWWTWQPTGVWAEDDAAVTNRVIDILGNRYRQAHASNTSDVVRRHVKELLLDNPNPSLMNFKNGMLNWRTGEMRAHSPEMDSTIQFPVEYDATATCPRFDAFLNEVMTPAYVTLAWEMLGYLLYSGNPLQKAFLFHGTGGNGKGTLMRVIQSMLGDANTSAQSLDALNGSRFAPAQLFGKIANLAGDIDGTFQESTAMFKMLTGEDRFSGEYKYGDSFGFSCWAVPVFSANKIPGSADVSVGYLRRWVVLEFGKSFAGEPVLGLSDLLIKELPGIVTKALKYLGPLLERRAFDVRAEASAGAEQFAMALDQVRQWVDEWCFPAPGKEVPRDHLYARYTTWATANGQGKLKASEFYSRLESAGYIAKKVKGQRVFCDIAMIEPTRDNDPARNEGTLDEIDRFFQ